MALGHQEMAYAVHTSTCTYLLDEDGVCRWIVSQQGVVPAHVRQCIGAQFVACLDLSVHGGLIGDLKPGARALFVRSEADRMVLLRTGLIRHVDDRRTPRHEQVIREPFPLAEPEPARVSEPRDTRVGRDSPVRHQTEWSQPVVTTLEGPSGSSKWKQPGAQPTYDDEPPVIQPRQYGKQAGLPYRAKPPRFGIVRRTGEEQTITVARSSRGEPLLRDDEPTAEPLYLDAETVRQRRD